MATIDNSTFKNIKDSNGLVISSFFLFQVDITEDGIGSPNFDDLHYIFDKFNIDNQNCNIKFKVTEASENCWKYEFQILKNDIPFIRIKIYEKTLEELNSNGVANLNTSDPLKRILLGNTDEDKHARNLFNYKGYTIGRLECSFYCS